VHIRHLRIAAVFVAGTACLAAAPHAARAPRWLVVSKLQPGITIHDAATDEVVCKAKTGLSPHEAAFSKDGSLVYVPVYGSANVGQPGTDEHAIHVIRAADCTEVTIIDTGEHTRPHAIAIGASGLAYITSENRQSVAIVDPAARRVVGAMPTGSSFTHFLAVTADERRLFTSNIMSKTISVLDVPTRTLSKTIETGANNQRMAISPDQRWFVSQIGPTGKVNFYRTADAVLDFDVPVDGAPFVGAFTPDSRFYVVMGSEPPAGPSGAAPGLRTWKIDVAARKVVAASSEALGAGTGGLGLNPLDGRVYISALAANRISVLDPQTLKVVKQIATEPTPDGIYFHAGQ
jgi:YVTN family beta-propeller protein